MTDSSSQTRNSSRSSLIIEVKGLHVSFGRQAVLRDIHLSIPSGQTLAIIGESGCGKTVLLKTLIGLADANRGEVRFDGKNIARLKEKELTKERVRFGFLFQNAALFDSMTVGENVSFPLRQHRDYGESQVDEMVAARLAEVGLPTAVMEKKPAELSGGMRKRVGLARALMLEPELMLYDEPTTGLDPIMSDVISELIISTRSRHHVTSIIVTHDMETVKKTADRVVMIYPLSRLKEGENQILFDGSPGELENCADRRVSQFVRGEARERLMEMRRWQEDAQGN